MPRPFGGDHLHRGVELRTAIAAQRTEDVTGQALRVHAHQDVVTLTVGSGHVAEDQGHVLDLVVDAGVADSAECAVARGDPGIGNPDHMLLVTTAPRDQVGDRDQRQVVFVGEDPQFGGLRHRALVLLADDLADHAGGREIGHPGQVHRGLGVTGAAQDATLLGAQRDHVAGAGEVVGGGGRIGEQPHRRGAVGGTDTGADALAGVNGDGVGGAVLVLVHRVHRRQTEAIAVVAVERDAQVSRGVPDHERDQFRRGLLGGEDQVALVLAILVVDDNNCLTRRDIGDRTLDRVELRALM